MKMSSVPLMIFTVLLSAAIFLCQAYAEMKKIDEGELARTNASVTGASVKDTAGVEKAALYQETLQNSAGSDKGEAFISPSVKVMEGIGISLNIKGQETFMFQVGGVMSTTMGGVTHVKSHQ